jgi:hypothetical protein
MAGFGVLITFVFFIYIVSRDRSQLVGLSISLRSIAKASYARHCRNTNVGGHALTDKFSTNKMEKLTADLFQTTISHGDKTQLQ